VTPPAPDGPGRPIFHGWVVLAASMAVIAVGTGTIFSLAVFLRPLEEEFGWTRSLISGAALVNWAIFGAGSFGSGALSDRIGARRVVAMGVALLGGALLLSSQVRSAGQPFHMVAHAMDLGVAKMAAASMLGLSGATSIAGRLSSGMLADRVGAKPALVGLLLLQATR
jgi:predicted MFS family arabinose efflux permease